MTAWLYKGMKVEESSIPGNAIGFVYKITRVSDGKFYIGKKLLQFKGTKTRVVKLKNGTKKKKKIHTLSKSDWETYWSSSEALKKDISELGEDAFAREILYFCSNKGALSYYELREQMDRRVMEIGNKSYNGIVNARVHKKLVTPVL